MNLKNPEELWAWFEEQHTLHNAIEVTYVVDGYEAQRTYDGNTYGPATHGSSVRDALVELADKSPIRRGFRGQ